MIAQSRPGSELETAKDEPGTAMNELVTVSAGFSNSCCQATDSSGFQPPQCPSSRAPRTLATESPELAPTLSAVGSVEGDSLKPLTSEWARLIPANGVTVVRGATM